MNFLAHLYLSGDNHDLMIGNFIADAVKGHAYESYPPAIKNGVLLHRAIDDYTDRHPIFSQSVKRIRLSHGKYAGVIADIFYDHFLAKNWKQYSAVDLTLYADEVYKLMYANQHIMPEKSQMFLKYLIKNNWLVSYGSIEGISNVLCGMSRRSRFENTMDKSAATLQQYYADFENEFSLFFEDVQKHVQQFVSTQK